MNEKDELFVQKALYGVILERGNQCLSQASMRTGCGIKALEKAKDSLIKMGLIRKVKNQGNRGELYYSYEVNI
jgi:predicted transcriptional regulator